MAPGPPKKTEGEIIMPNNKGLPVDDETYQRVVGFRDSIQAKMDQSARELTDFNECMSKFHKRHLEGLLEIMKEVRALNEQIALLYPGGKN